MSVVTALLCGASAWTARRGLRATEEALAAAGAPCWRSTWPRPWAGAVPPRGGPLRHLVGDLLRRRRRGRPAAGPADPDDDDLAAGRAARRPAAAVPAAARTPTERPAGWPPPSAWRPPTSSPPGGAASCARGVVAGRRSSAVAGVLASQRLRPTRSRRGWRPAWSPPPRLALGCRPVPACSPRSLVAGGRRRGGAGARLWDPAVDAGAVVAAGLGLALLTLAVLSTGRTAGPRPGGRGGAAVVRRRPAAGSRWASLALALAAVVPLLLAAAVRSRRCVAGDRRGAARPGLAVLAPPRPARRGAGTAARRAGRGRVRPRHPAGGRPEEWVAAAGGGRGWPPADLRTVGAWGQVGLQLAVVGVAAAGYAVVAAAGRSASSPWPTWCSRRGSRWPAPGRDARGVHAAGRGRAAADRAAPRPGGAPSWAAEGAAAGRRAGAVGDGGRRRPHGAAPGARRRRGRRGDRGGHAAAPPGTVRRRRATWLLVVVGPPRPVRAGAAALGGPRRRGRSCSSSGRPTSGGGSRPGRRSPGSRRCARPVPGVLLLRRRRPRRRRRPPARAATCRTAGRGPG